VAKNLFLEVINDMVLEMCTSLMSDADCYFRSVQSIAAEFITDVADTLSKYVTHSDMVVTCLFCSSSIYNTWNLVY